MTRAKSTLERCPWPGISDPEYARYHDEEWGVPQASSAALFEKITLEGFQAGLSWLTILRKRPAFRKAFHGFNAERIARYTARDINRLMNNAGIVRNRAKIEATISNARAYLKLSQRTDFAAFLWGHLEDGPILNKHRSLDTVPASTPLSHQISKSLKREGFRFVGPTTVYAFMQSTGMINDHLTACPRHDACARLQREFQPPSR